MGTRRHQTINTQTSLRVTKRDLIMGTIIRPIMKPNLIKILLLLITGALLLSPYLNFQDILSQGDHGRDLYAFWATANGQMPYQDYWWVYGPLMPYYYALFFKIFGTAVPSVLLGQILLETGAGLFIFLSLSLWVSPLMAYAGAIWFWVFRPQFFFTYNHAGGILLLAATAYHLLAYIKKPRDTYLWRGLIGIFLLGLVKINFGLAALVVFLGGIFAADRLHHIRLSSKKKIFYWAAALGLPVLFFLIYFAFLRGLPIYAVRQCLPYLSVDHPYNAPLSKSLWKWWQALALNINAGWTNRIFALMILGLSARCLYRLLRAPEEKEARHPFLFSILILLIFYAVGLHEYIKSIVLYRTEWVKPFSVLMIFLLLGRSMGNIKKSVQIMLVLALLGLASARYIPVAKTIAFYKRPDHFLAPERGRLFITNNPPWIETVSRATRLLETELAENETFFTLPFAPLYYYLASRFSPTRQLIFFEHINIPAQQEKKIIAELEAQRVNTIVVTNRAISSERGMGLLGHDYCPLIGKYIVENFKESQRLGEWRKPAGWAWSHGVVILKRRPAERRYLK